MKPRNRFEKVVLAESKHLRPITKTQSDGHFVSASTTLPTDCPKVAPLVWTADIVG